MNRAKRRRERKLASGSLVRVSWEGKDIAVKPAVAEALAELPAIRSAGAAAEMDVAVSLVLSGQTHTAHFQFNAWASGRRALDWWPGNGTWIGHGRRGQAFGWREALEVAAQGRP